MTQEEFNEMLQAAIAQGLGGGTYTSVYSGEEIDTLLGMTSYAAGDQVIADITNTVTDAADAAEAAQAAAEQALADLIAATAPIYKYLGNLTPTSNPDTLLQPGFWRWTGSNTPTAFPVAATPGVLEYIGPNNTTGVAAQRLTYSNGRVFTRWKTTTGWGTWRELARLSDIPALDTTLAVSGAAADAKAAGDAIAGLRSDLDGTGAFAWPGEWERGRIGVTTGADSNSNYDIRRLGYIPVGGGETVAVSFPVLVPGADCYEFYIFEYSSESSAGFIRYKAIRSYDESKAYTLGAETAYIRFWIGALPRNTVVLDLDAYKGFSAVFKNGTIFLTADDVRRDVSGALDFAFAPGNNLLPLDPYATTFHGVTMRVENGVISLSGTATSGTRIKLTNGYAEATTAPAAWAEETLPQFKVGETYSYHHIVLEGTLPPGVSVSLRDSNGDFIVSRGTPEATLESVPTYAMLYIPSGTALDVTFAVLFIKGGTGDYAYLHKLNSTIRVDNGKQFAQPDMTADYVWNSELESAIKFPESYDPAGDATPLLILCHGLSVTISASVWGSDTMLGLVERFANDGFAVLDVNRVTSQDWCNPALIKKYVAAVRDATKTYNLVPTAVYGESMGSLIALCLSTLYPVRASVISGIRLDLAARYAILSDANKAIVDSNLGFTDGFDALKASGWDKTAVSVADANGDSVCPVQFPPTFFMAGGDDTDQAESYPKVDEIRRGGTVCQFVEYAGASHHDVCYLLKGTMYEDAMAWIRAWL